MSPFLEPNGWSGVRAQRFNLEEPAEAAARKRGSPPKGASSYTKAPTRSHLQLTTSWEIPIEPIVGISTPQMSALDPILVLRRFIGQFRANVIIYKRYVLCITKLGSHVVMGTEHSEKLNLTHLSATLLVGLKGSLG